MIHHISIIVSSEASVAFYEKLGFEVEKRIARSYDVVVLMRGHGMGLELFVDPSHPPKGSVEPLGFRNLTLQVDGFEALVREKELDAGPIMSDWNGERYCIVLDPDGNKVLLHE